MLSNGICCIMLSSAGRKDGDFMANDQIANTNGESQSLAPISSIFEHGGIENVNTSSIPSTDPDDD